MPLPLPTALVVPHTHWDRAWYWPYERFRVRLGLVFEALFAAAQRDPRWRFTCDGQTLMAEDHLAAHPDDAPALRALAEAGRLKLGPMYGLSDLYCTGGEALIRNLLLGLQSARRIGGERGLQRTLHMPDTFGIPPELPKIAAGFGLDSFTFMRGHPEEVPELTSMGALRGGEACSLPREARMFLWLANDGSAVRVFRLRDGYANACGLGLHPEAGADRDDFDPEADAARLLEAARRQASGGQGEPYLLLAGVDHQIPPSRLGTVLDQANQAGEFHFVFADLDELGAALTALPESSLPRYSGEFHGSGAASVLGGTLTTRIYLKQTNALVERLLVHQAEPAAALLLLHDLGSPALASLAVAWRHLLVTHPHDDICGCSVDAVHRANEHQMEQARQAADAVRRACTLRLLQAHGADLPGEQRPSFALVRLQPGEARQRVEVRLDFEGWERWGDRTLPAHYRVVDEHGTGIPARELSRSQSTEHPRQVAVLELYPRLVNGRLTRFYLEATPPPAPPPALAGFANEHLRVQLQPDGAFSLEDLTQGTRWPDLGFFTGQTDVGDSYDFDALEQAPESRLQPQSLRVEPLAGTEGLVGVRIHGILDLPGPCADAAQGPCGSCAQAYTLDLSLAPGHPTLEVRIELTSVMQDYRLRWNLGLPRAFGETHAGLKFDAITRPTRPVSPPQRIAPEHPADAFFGVGDAEGGLLCFAEHPGNHEYVAHDAQPRLAWTLVRAVRWLTNPRPLHSRGNNAAGPHTWVPEAQCLGRTLVQRFGIQSLAPEHQRDGMRRALLWRQGPLFGQLDPTAAWVCRPGVEPSDLPWPRLHGEGAIVAACKPALAGEGIIYRIHQATGVDEVCTLDLPQGWQAIPCGLDEAPQLGDNLPPAPLQGRCQLPLRGGQLLTLRLTKAPPPAHLGGGSGSR